VRIATWNVNGIRSREAQLLAWLEAERPDVVCLQELKATGEQVPEALRALPGYWARWHGSKAYSGVAVLLRKERFPDEPAFSSPAFDRETRALVAEAGGLAFASLYVPNGGRDLPGKMAFLEDLDRYVTERRAGGGELFICGDLNIARTDRDVHPKERKPGLVGQLPEERALLERILGRGLTDVGRALDPENEGLFTWWAPWRNLRQRNIGWRIDYVLATPGLAQRARASAVAATVGTSDHAPVTVTVED
jgi:exodeoxyribonuclease-3